MALIRSREALVSTRTQLVNHVRGTVKSFGGRLPKCPARSFHNRALEHIPEVLWPALEPILQTIGSLTQRIHDYDRQLETISKEHYPETELLRQVEGVGPLTALTFALTMEDPYRFEKSRSMGAYLGLVPARDQSGDRDPQKRISKEGDEMLRKLLVSGAHYILGPFGSDSDLRRHGQKIASRGGKNAKKRAAVAVARKLAVLLHSLWVSGEVYEPLRNTHRFGVRRRLDGKRKPKHSEAKEEEVGCHNVDRKAAYPLRFLPHRFGSSKATAQLRTWLTLWE